MANWIKGAIKHPGAFTAKANAAGEGVQEYAREKSGASGTLGKQARLAITLGNMHKGKGGGSMGKGMSKKAIMTPDRKNRLKDMLSSRNTMERDNTPLMAAVNKARTKKYGKK